MSRGSVGASGDLAPLAHLALVLIGEGFAWRDSQLEPGASALRREGLTPATLAPKEGLALINGTQPSTALLGLTLGGGRTARARGRHRRRTQYRRPSGVEQAVRARMHAARGFAGQTAAAANLVALLDGGAINAAHANCGRVQDAYSMRCVPQVHGAARDAFAYGRKVFTIEANAATDNPMVFVDTRDIVSGGNFHGAPVAMAADFACAGLAPLATISERRSERLVNPTLSGLPAFLTRHGGLQSGLMMAQVTAADARARAARAGGRNPVRLSGDRSAAPADLVRTADARP